ncbi:glucose-6-phosphatase catalytic subunit 1-like [Haliotis cracherodii]|uniref:glucose-6-phosphatase catalytic subunit 1-like n=1 Tax=Haliotis cracherodii TaxID=6455 RepID=UPI0039E7DCAD
MAVMEDAHVMGVTIITQLQHWFQNQSEFMLFLSHVGDPHNAFLIYFPLAYFLRQSVGRRVVWVAAIAEWLNAVFKLILHGERPYWWAQESTAYTNATRPQLQQFRLTCETGPGSPSGHAMVTSAVLYILVSDYLFHSKVKSVLMRILSWTLFCVVMLAVNLSRCYIATHFPHQVVAGVIVGVSIGQIFNSFSTETLTFKHYLAAAGIFITTTLMTFGVIQAVGLDAMWSVSKVQQWCARAEWVYLDTTLFYSVTRDASSLFGLGIALFVLPQVNQAGHAMANRLVHISISLIASRVIDSYKLPHSPITLFYLLAFCKFVLLFVFIVNIVPRINLFSNNSKQDEKKMS